MKITPESLCRLRRLSYCYWAVALLLAGAGSDSARRLWAGEAIQFTKEKAVQGPDLETRGTKDKLTILTRKRSLESQEMMDLSGSAGSFAVGQVRRDRKEEKRLQNARTEREAWILLDRGELQEKDDRRNELGVRDYSGQGIEKEKTAGEIWFGPKQDRAANAPGQQNGPAGPANSRDGTARSASAPVPKSDADDSDISNGKSAATREPDRLNLSGKEVQLRNALAPAEPNDSFSSKQTSLSLGDDRTRRREDFGSRAGDGPLFSPNNSLGLGKGLGLGRDSVGPSFGPGLSPGLLDGPGKSPALLNSSRLGSMESFGSPGFSTPPGSGFNSFNSQPRNDFAPASPRSPVNGR